MGYRLLIGVAALMLTGITTAKAHAPVVELKDSSADKPIRITWSLQTSIAVYSYFENTGDIDVVVFEVSEKEAAKGVPLVFHTLVPACKPYADLLPSVAVVGPAQDSLPGMNDTADLPFNISVNDGIRILVNTEQGATWYERYSGKNYFWQKSLSTKLVKPGKYYLYTWSPAKKIGDYVLAVGTRERWGLREMARATRHMPRLLSDREIHDATCRAELKNQTPSTNPIPGDIHAGEQ